MDDPNIADALNHQITDEEGKIVAEETAPEEAAPQEQTPVEESATAEKSVEEESSPKEETKSESEPTTEEPEMVPTAEDETGKRYVPESRFKEVYAKWKEAERKAMMQGTVPPQEPIQAPARSKPLDKAEALEIELLRSTLPQFNPESPEYSKDVDELGYSVYESSKDKKGNYTMTRIEAARRALNIAKRITSKVAEIKSEARSAKAQQSDQGITTRVISREGQKLDPNKMSLEEMEEWLKANGSW